MKKNFLILVAIFLVGFQTACNLSKENSQSVDMPDVSVEKGKTGNEVVFDDSKFEEKNKQVSTFGEQKEEQNYTDKDGSTVRISYDGYGNRIETRHFFNHPNLKMLVVTKATDGTTEGLVFGHNNEHKKLPPELIDQALTAQGNDIAYKVGITTTKRISSSPTIVRNTQPAQVYPKIPDPRIQPVNPQPQPQPEVTVEEKPETTPPAENQTGNPKTTIAQDKKKENGENNHQ